MLITHARRGRQVAATAVLAGAALLVTGCQSATSTAAAPPVATATPSVTASPSGTSTFLAEGQEINGTALYEPACTSGCPISGDSTAILSKMTWTTWSATEAIGTGTYQLDDCNPNCAAAKPIDVAVVLTLSQPVKECSASGTRWFWSRASFTFPNGLPKSLQGDNAPQNPWTFSSVVTAAQQTCAS